MEERVGAGWNSVVLSSHDDDRSAVGGALFVFQSSAVGDGANGVNPTADLSSSSVAGIGEGESRLIFAESLPNGGVRFVFLVPEEEFKMEETVKLLSGEWRPLADDEFKAVRESIDNNKDRLTIILPKALGKQRFLRLIPLK